MWFRLVERDRRILALVGEHKVLSTYQIAAVEFGSVRRAQDRLRQLRELGVVFGFRDSYSTGGTSQTRYALGYLGARLLAAQRAEKPPAPGAYAQRLERLGLWPKLGHQLGVNQFFCDLAGYSRRNPATVTGPDGVGGLTQWWSESRCAEFFWIQYAGREARLRADGYGCWEEHGRWVRFFLEHDTGTEPLGKVAGKLAAYMAFPTDRFGVLLFSVHSSRRETALRAALRHAMGAGRSPGVVVATAARDQDHPDGPAGPVWGLWTPRSADTVTQRYRLAELPSRGPQVAHHAPWVGQPFSQAAFDATDPAMVSLLNADHPAPTAPAEPYSTGYQGDDADEVVLDVDYGDVYPPPLPAPPTGVRQSRARRWVV